MNEQTEDHARRLAYQPFYSMWTETRTALLSCADELTAMRIQNAAMRDALTEIAKNENNEPYAAQYANDILRNANAPVEGQFQGSPHRIGRMEAVP